MISIRPMGIETQHKQREMAYIHKREKSPAYAVKLYVLSLWLLKWTEKIIWQGLDVRYSIKFNLYFKV